MTRREFPKHVKVAAFKRADGKCEQCSQKLFVGNVEYDHGKEDFFGGDPTLENCVVLCRGCHKAKTRSRAPVVAKTRRQEAMVAGIKTPKGPPLMGTKRSGWKRPINGPAERRSP